MNREIKFRGKRTDNGEWVYGYLWCTPVSCHIYPQGSEYSVSLGSYRVIPETVGQFTGLHDKNGDEIYEGDVLKFHSQSGNDHFISVRYSNKDGSWHGDSKHGLSLGTSAWRHDTEIIGNIHDNPELIKS